ncbi:reverse transcriptase-like protein [Lapidilactobacillus achengensis]|uniref:Reverse transcriptase-like protein n=1 Tax=Lapidilactobacillus achengensis TaxID=2486000 RepID=A0ABW1UNR3_9LACO|nr:reverse transcriptase-like protein [Lapidilactobacillus achengensis]
MLWLTTDAAVDRARQITGLGFFIQDHDRPEMAVRWQQQVPYTDNHHAEFAAVLAGLTYLAQHWPLATSAVILQTDSQLVAQALTKRYAKHYDTELKQILAVSDQCQLFIVKQITDRQNTTAHHLARQAIYGSQA